MSYANLDEVLAELNEGTLVSGMVPHALMDFLSESNIEEVMSGLPHEYRTFVLEWAHDVAFAPERELLNIAGVTNLSEMRVEDKGHPRRNIVFGVFRDWFERHPWPQATNNT